MGGISSAFQYIPIVKEGLGIVSSALSGNSSYRAQEESQKQALRQLQQAQALQQKQSQAEAELARENIAVQSRASEEARLSALRRAVARQKAQFGSSGVGSSGGSARAVLLGLFDETEEELAEREKLDNLRNRALDLSLTSQNSMNVLQRTQLQERQKIDRLSSRVDKYSSPLGSGLDMLDYASRISALF